jgi:hypothetical protein
MPFYVSQTIKKAVFDRVHRAEGNGHYLNVYEVAQDIQTAYPHENVALEDIVAMFVDCAAGRPIAIELSQPVTAGHIPVDVIVG